MKNFGGGKKPFVRKGPPGGGQNGRKRPKDSKDTKKKQPSLKNKIRGLERLVRLERLDPKIKAIKEKELLDLKKEQDNQDREEREKKLAKRYHHVKFFERVKIERQIAKLERKAGQPSGDADKQSDLSEEEKLKLNKLKDDLLYVMHFPKSEKYVSLLKNATDAEGQAKLDSERQRLMQLVRQQLAEIAAVTEADEGKGLKKPPLGASKRLREESAASGDEDQDDFFLGASDEEGEDDLEQKKNHNEAQRTTLAKPEKRKDTAEISPDLDLRANANAKANRKQQSIATSVKGPKKIETTISHVEKKTPALARKDVDVHSDITDDSDSDEEPHHQHLRGSVRNDGGRLPKSHSDESSSGDEDESEQDGNHEKKDVMRTASATVRGGNLASTRGREEMTGKKHLTSGGSTAKMGNSQAWLKNLGPQEGSQRSGSGQKEVADHQVGLGGSERGSTQDLKRDQHSKRGNNNNRGGRGKVQSARGGKVIAKEPLRSRAEGGRKRRKKK